MSRLPRATVRIRIFFAILVALFAAGLVSTLFLIDEYRILSTILYVVLGILWAFVAIHCYIRAEERGANPILWGTLVYLFPLLGLAVYLIYFRGRKETGEGSET
jgi:predicted membrane channel-forming protein YqfA (hemolysin III family)